MSLRFAVVQFPGSNCDQDCLHALGPVLGQNARFVWHKERSLGETDAVIVPGGFSYGDYLRCGAIARFSPVMQSVIEFGQSGGLVLGICNGFQILCEAGLLPGALVRNRSLQFRCLPVYLRTENPDSPFTAGAPPDRPLKIPIAHGEGCYFADAATLADMESNGQILWTYVDAEGRPGPGANPNGSVRDIAGVCNRERNVAGLMPHPERACEVAIGGTDGLHIFNSMIQHLKASHVGT